MDVTWDPRKAAANHGKHKVSFEEASTRLASAINHRRGPGPLDRRGRWIAFGLSNRRRLLGVSHIEEGDVIRIISARAATRPERRLYEED